MTDRDKTRIHVRERARIQTGTELEYTTRDITIIQGKELEYTGRGIPNYTKGKIWAYGSNRIQTGT